ncbi:MAG: hypothetical protein ACTSW1_15870 [Candidatus Hodarchaeales archaeon]
MEEKENIWYIAVIALVFLILPLGNDALTGTVSLFVAIILAIPIIIISIRNIPVLSPFLPETIGDSLIKLLTWIGVLLTGILIIVIRTLLLLQSGT